jgi:tetratricopeptide (TPR) repeat protein
MSETDLQLGGGYTHQWECATLLALNYFFDPVRYNPTLFDLINDFLGQVAEIHLEGEDRESGVDLEDINLVNGDRRILIQVKTKQAEGERWTPTDPLLLKALYKFYDSRFFTEQPEDTRFVFLTNRPFNPDLVQVKSAIREGTVAQCAEADKLCQHFARYARREKGKSIDADRFREMLMRTALVEYLAVDEVKANVQAKLQAHGRRDWEQAHALLFEHFARQSTRVGGGTVTRASVIEVLGPPRRAAPPPLPTRSTAPAPPDHFTGRQAELDALAQALTTGDTPQAITALQGMGGIGKTALAAQLAAQLDGAFPGGVFWADLPANQGDPLPVLAAWARLCGHDVSALPDPQARAQAVRGILAGRIAEQGRLLVVLDDVRAGWLDGARLLGAARPPGVPLLLTTRDEELALALGATVRRLDVLPLERALELLAALAKPVVEREPEAARRLAERVGCLPLALELAGKLAALRARKPGWRLASLCAQVETRAGETLQLKGQRGLVACFSLSYEALDAEGQRLFRALGVFAPAPFAAEPVAAILGWEVRAVEAGLDALVALALAHWEEGGEGRQGSVGAREREQGGGVRYVFHPLLRDYAAALLKEAGEGPAARAAHIAHYLAYAEAHKQPTAADYDALEAERPDILAAMDRAYQEKQWAQVRRFAWALCNPVSGYLGVRGYWGELRTRLEQAIRAADAEGYRRDAAAFSWCQAILLQNLGELNTARQEYERMMVIFDELGERTSVAGLLHQLGRLAEDTGDYAEARRLYRQSLDINEELGNRAGIASTLHQLGVLAQGTGDYAEARRLYRQSLDISEELGNRAGIATTLGQLAVLTKNEGDLAEAERLCRQAIAIGEELGDVVGMSIDMFNLALLCEDQGRLDEALPLLERAVEIAERTGFYEAERWRGVLEQVRGQLER